MSKMAEWKTPASVPTTKLRHYIAIREQKQLCENSGVLLRHVSNTVGPNTWGKTTQEEKEDGFILSP